MLLANGSITSTIVNTQNKKLTWFGIGSLLVLLVHLIELLPLHHSSFLSNLYFSFVRPLWSLASIFVYSELGWSIWGSLCGNQGKPICISTGYYEPYFPWYEFIINVIANMLCYGLIFLLLYLIYRKFKPSPANSG